MKKTIKMISTLLIVMLITFTFSTTVMAVDASGIIDSMQQATVDDAATSGITTVGGQIVKIITTVGIIAAVIILAVLGIKYMMGSASEKAEYKKTMIPYIIGAVLIFAASAIVRAIFGIVGGISI